MDWRWGAIIVLAVAIRPATFLSSKNTKSGIHADFFLSLLHQQSSQRIGTSQIHGREQIVCWELKIHPRVHSRRSRIKIVRMKGKDDM